MSQKKIKKARRSKRPEGPYADDLEYIEDELEWVSLERRRQHLDGELADGGRLERYLGEDDGAHAQRVMERLRDQRKERRSIGQRIHPLRRRIDRRLQASRDAGVPMALDRMCDAHSLSQMERMVVLRALRQTFRDPRGDRDEERIRTRHYGGLSIEALHNFLELGFRDRLRIGREMFRADAPLIRNEILAPVHLSREPMLGDFFMSRVRLTEPAVEYLLGSSDLSGDLTQFSDLEDPRADMKRLVISDEDRRRILSVIDRHDEYLNRRKEWGFDDLIRYGRGRLFLFHGPPGTGKTMTAHAIADHLGLRVLNVDIITMIQNSEAARFLPNLFRQARLKKALLFFDECEMIFADRNKGNLLMTMLLTEIERFDGVAVLATNLPHMLDDALRRRVMVEVEFQAPDAKARAEIWAAHLPSTAPVNSDVDLRRLAERYPLTGGLIKNTVLAAVANAVHRGDEELRMEHLEYAARGQVGGTGAIAIGFGGEQ